MMYQGIDLSRFKKIAGDGKSSKLKHSKGHEITIAHSALSPEMRERISGMPVHMAEGGDPTDIDPESPAPLEEPAAETSEAPASAAPAAVPEDPNTVVVMAPRRPAPPPNLAQDLDNEDALFAQDAERGHINPKTMQDLFAEKSTLGKIGTIFGLLVGGAGSGLTHQPNALLGMMQKQIDNDLEAQKASNNNSQNWLKLTHEHQMQKAQTAKLGAETALTEAQTGKVPSEIAINEATARHTDADAHLIATNVAKSRMQIAAYQHLLGITNKMPPGPQKDAATNLLTGTLGPGIMNDIKERNAKTAGQIDLRSAVRGDAVEAPPQENEAGVDFDKLNTLAQQGQMADQLGLPGGMRGPDVSQANAEAAHVAENRAIAKMFVDAFNRLDTSFGAGRLNPAERNAEIASLGQQMAQRVGNSTSQKEYERILQSMFPEATDWGGAREAKFRHGIEALKALEAGTPTLDRFALKTPFPSFKRARKRGASGTAQAGTGKTNQPKDGETGTSKSGKPMIFKDGRWVYK